MSNEELENYINAIKYCVDMEVQDYAYKYSIEDVEEYSDGVICAHINFKDQHDMDLQIKISRVSREGEKYDCTFQVDMGEDYWEVSNYWDSSAKYFWMAALS